ncbi:MAG TPA: hypothetical protein VFG99_04305 [Chloroflexia bacterium]|nr:hypothetical protein [Chloroflexia bacterium]
MLVITVVVQLTGSTVSVGVAVGGVPVITGVLVGVGCTNGAEGRGQT